MNTGDKIISEIIKQGMIKIAHPDPAEDHVFVWSANAAEQLDAVVNSETFKLRKASIEMLGVLVQLKTVLKSQHMFGFNDTLLDQNLNNAIASAMEAGI